MRRLLLLTLVLFAAAPAFAATGIFQTYVVISRGSGNVFYEGSGPDDNSFNPLFQTFFFSPTATLTLNGAEINTFKNNGGNVTGAALFYRVYAQGATAPVFTQVDVPFNANLGDNGDQRWQRTNAGINLNTECGTGNVCALEFYFQAFTNEGDRFDSNGGSNFSRPFGVAPFAQPVFNGPGYRLLSTPQTGVTVDALANVNLVQGIAGGAQPGPNEAQYPGASPNFFTSYNTDGAPTTDVFSGYVRPATTSATVEPGRGFFWQFYDEAINPDDGASGGGTSDSRELTGFTLNAAGPFEQGVVSGTGSGRTVTVSRAFAQNSTDQFYMIGNPFAYPLELDGISATGGTIGTVFAAFDPQIGNYVNLFKANDGNGNQPDVVDMWQGFFVQMFSPTGAPTFTFNALETTARRPSPFYGRGGESAAPYVQFVLTGTTATTGASVTDVAAYVRLLPDALVGWDPHDASKLLPLSGPYALVAPVGERDGAPYRTAVNSLPDDGVQRTVAVAFLATEPGSYSLAWNGPDALPEGWRAELHDLVDGPIVDLRTATSYPFTSAATDWTDRFSLVLTPADAVATEGAAPTAALRVLAPRPNPASGQTEVLVELGAAQAVRATLVDALGRRVATVYDGEAAAGTLALRLDVAGLAPGVYALRVQGATAAATRTVTVAR